MNAVIDHFRRHPDQKIVLRVSADVLCHCCPNNQNGRCSTEDKVLSYDRSCLSLCGFSEGQQLEWGFFVDTIAESLIKTSKWKQICKNCCWFPLCERHE
jgi:hypothetical protein